MISLSVKRNTFQSKLSMLGYDYKIKQYEDFIFAIRRMILREVYQSRKDNNLKDVLNKIFGDYKKVSFMIFDEIELIDTIRKEYLIERIEKGKLNLFFIDKKDTVFTEDEQIDAYILTLRTIQRGTRSELDHYLFSLYPFLRYKMTPYKAKLLKCLKQGKIELLESEKKIILEKFEGHKMEWLDSFDKIRKRTTPLSYLSSTSTSSGSYFGMFG